MFYLGGIPNGDQVSGFLSFVATEMKLGAAGEHLTLRAVRRSDIVGNVRGHYFNFERQISLTRVIWAKLRLKAEFPDTREAQANALANFLQLAETAETRGDHETAQQFSMKYLTLLQSGVHSHVTRRHEQALRQHLFAIIDPMQP